MGMQIAPRSLIASTNRFGSQCPSSFCSYLLAPPLLSQMVCYDFQFHRPMFLLSNSVCPPYFPNNSERKPSSPHLSILTASLRCGRDLYKKIHSYIYSMKTWLELALISYSDRPKNIVYYARTTSYYLQRVPFARVSVSPIRMYHDMSQLALGDHLCSVATR